MSETPDDRPRPTPRPRPGATARPSPRPRVAGARREREDGEGAAPAERTGRATATATATPARPRPAARPRAGSGGGARSAAPTGRAAAAGSISLDKDGRGTDGRRTRRARPPVVARDAEPARRSRTVALVLAVLCLVAAAGGGWLIWERTHPPYVDSSVFDATRAGVQAVYAYDYKDSDGSVARKLDVLTGDLRDQYKTDLGQGGIIDTYEQVSATTSYDVVDVGLQQINPAQDAATLVVFGQYVVKSVNSGTQTAPQGSECTVTADGAQSCTQTVQVHVIQVDGTWKISELTLLTTG
jgi:hypothetical protein